jgi:hypothetical protein
VVSPWAERVVLLYVCDRPKQQPKRYDRLGDEAAIALRRRPLVTTSLGAEATLPN